MIEIYFFLLVMIAVWFTFVNLGRALTGQSQVIAIYTSLLTQFNNSLTRN